MNKQQQALSLFKEQGVIPLFYHPSLQVSTEVVTALYQGGIRSVEYTNRGANALENFTALVKLKPTLWPDLLLGIGTIKTEADADNFLAAKPDFVVCPCMVPEVGAKVQAAGLLWIPGTMTTTEIAGAQKAGAGFVKLFPGSLLGPSYVSAVSDIFPDMQFMPTGGVEPEKANLSAWFKSGVIAVGMGSKLITKALLDSGDYSGLSTQTSNLLQLISEIRG